MLMAAIDMPSSQQDQMLKHVMINRVDRFQTLGKVLVHSMLKRHRMISFKQLNIFLLILLLFKVAAKHAFSHNHFPAIFTMKNVHQDNVKINPPFDIQ